MRARHALSILIIGVVGLFPLGARAAGGQQVKGAVFVPAGDVCAYPEALLESALRAGWIVGYGFNVNPATQGKPFSLEANHDFADLDITFFGAPGGWFSKRSLSKGEAGIVPSGATRALVCLVLGAPARFTYQAG